MSREKELNMGGAADKAEHNADSNTNTDSDMYVDSDEFEDETM